MTRCAAHRCPEAALPDDQLCRRHRRRLEAGGGLPTAGEPVLGDPSGYATYGRLDVGQGGAVCHECGQLFINVGIHAQRVHRISAEEYRRRHGVEGSLALPPGDGPRRRPKACPRCGRVVISRRRTCDECWTAELERRAQRPAPRPRWRQLKPEEADALRAAEQDELPQLVGTLQADRVPSTQIAEALGVSRQRMTLLYPRAEYRRR